MTVQAQEHQIPKEREACPGCGGRAVVWTEKNGQRPAHCTGCGRYVYCVPNHELGLGPGRRRSSSPETVDATQAARIRIRDRGVCVMCRTAEGPLEIGHLIPLAGARKYPSLRQAMGSDANLALMCRECNAGLAARPVSLLWMAALHMEQERS